MNDKPRKPPRAKRPGPWLGTPLHKLLGSTLPLSVWTLLMTRMVALIVAEILANPLGFVLPANLGLIVVGKQKARSTFRDYKALCQTGENRVQRNFHSFGHVYRVDWKPLTNTNFPNRTLYKFKACRAVNRLLAKHIFAGQDYLPVTYRQTTARV